MTAFWAIAVWGSVAGSIGLLMRKKWAMWAFVVSCVGMVCTTIYNFGITNGAEIMGSEGVIFSVVIWVIALFLLWYSWSQAKKGVLALRDRSHETARTRASDLPWECRRQNVSVPQVARILLFFRSLNLRSVHEETVQPVFVRRPENPI